MAGTTRPTTKSETPLFDAVAAACGTPADLGHIARAIGMTPSEAYWAVASATAHGRVRSLRYGLHEAVS